MVEWTKCQYNGFAQLSNNYVEDEIVWKIWSIYLMETFDLAEVDIYIMPSNELQN